MDVTTMTWIVAVGGLVLISLLAGLQLVAVVRPQTAWTIANVYGGDPSATDPKAYFAFNRGFAWADPFFWAPVQIGEASECSSGRDGVSCSPWLLRCLFGTRPSPSSFGIVTGDSGRTHSAIGCSRGACGRCLVFSRVSIALSGLWNEEDVDGRKDSRSGRWSETGV